MQNSSAWPPTSHSDRLVAILPGKERYKTLNVSQQSPGASRAGRESASARRLEARLRGQVGKTIARYAMIEAGDRVMVCLSGGKDSYVMLDLLRSLQRNAPVDFELVAVNLDQKQPGFPEQVLPDYLAAQGVPFEVVEQDTYSVVQRVLPEGKTQCGLCSRLRRGALYNHAAKRGFTKIALGHHRDDIVETFFLNLFHGSRLAAMPPKLRSDDGRHVVIRPLAACAEKDIARLARARDYPIIPCTLCGSQPNLQRVAIKRMLADWELQWPGRTSNMFRALQNIAPSQLADDQLHDFKALVARAGSDEGQQCSDEPGGDTLSGFAAGAAVVPFPVRFSHDVRPSPADAEDNAQTPNSQ